MLPGGRLARIDRERLDVLELGEWVASSPEDRAQLADGEPLSAAAARRLERQAARLVWREGDVVVHHGDRDEPTR